MLRQRLVTELGLEPSIEVQRVQRTILNADAKPADNGDSAPVERSRPGRTTGLAYLSVG